MNTFARQSISQTFVKACTAAVLLVTCLQSQAADSNVTNQSEEFRSETMASIQSTLNATDIVAPSFNIFNTAVSNAVVTQNFRAETLDSMQAELKNTEITKPSLDLLNTSIESSMISNNFRIETLNSMHDELNNNLGAPSLDALSVALTASNIQADEKQFINTQVLASTNNILPAIVSLGSIEFETKDTLSRQATMIALNFTIDALENASTNLAVSQRLTL